MGFTMVPIQCIAKQCTIVRLLMAFSWDLDGHVMLYCALCVPHAGIMGFHKMASIWLHFLFLFSNYHALSVSVPVPLLIVCHVFSSARSQ